jgi:ATP-dependent Clp protease ATP-binding subunit ClpA
MQGSITSFIEVIYNVITIYLPHNFAVSLLLKTLFLPWKGIVSAPKEKGWDMIDQINTFFGNAIAVGIGFTVRSSVILTFFLLEALIILSLPILFILFFISLPITILMQSTKKDPKIRKQQLLERFVTSHVIDTKYIPKATEWFTSEYKKVEDKALWYSSEQIKKTKPFGTDWAAGFTPNLDEYTTYLEDTGALVGREAELKELETLLIKERGSNVVLVGEEGVGKKSILTLFNSYMQTEDSNPLVRYKKMYVLNMDNVLSTVLEQKSREALLENLLLEAQKAGNVMIIVPNIHNYLTSSETSIDMSNTITKFATASHSNIICTTTPFFYQSIFGKHPNLQTMFNRLSVNELNPADTLIALQSYALHLEYTYKQVITIDAILYVIEKSAFYFADAFFPSKAATILESICVNLQSLNKTERIGASHIDNAISKKAHVPTVLSSELKTELINLEEDLNKKVLGQEVATAEVASSLRRSFMLLGKRKKPLASFLFLGPTGVGKTETAKALSNILFSEQGAHIVRFDMSTYQSKDDIPKLIGDSTTGAAGLLTTAIAEHPYGVLLLDELEKAHKDLFNLLLTVLDEGYITDGFGKIIDCKSLMVIATSNAGVEFLYSAQNAGQVVQSNALIEALIQGKYFAPEFLNRFDGVVAFNPITKESALKIATIMVNDVIANIKELHNITVTISTDTLQRVIAANFNPMYGARNLDHALRLHIEDVIAKKFLDGSVKSGDTISL